MGAYLPSKAAVGREMCEYLGIDSADRLFDGIPGEVRLSRELKLPSGMSEQGARRELDFIAGENTAYRAVFRGAGAEKHYIPAIVRQLATREEFLTAYTPYQPEISQGVLQSIYEFQSMVCELYGMDVANASAYDGASALAEAAQMCRERARVRVIISGAVNPRYAQVVRTYAAGKPVDTVKLIDGRTDHAALESMLGDDAACVLVQQPNYYGLFEDVRGLAKIAHAKGAKLVVCQHPLAAAITYTPGEAGADVCVGEGQPLGLNLGCGGPYIGLMACKKAMMRKLPGRIVGETQDKLGRRAFVLTLQAREQHIRRERASSSLCSNQAFCALLAGAYMACMGEKGLAQAANQCHSKAAYFERRLADAGFARVNAGEYFCEFLTRCPVAPDALLSALERRGILGGLPVDGSILWCVTEENTKAQMDEVIDIIKEVCA